MNLPSTIAARVWRSVTPMLFALYAAEVHASYTQFELEGRDDTFVLAQQCIYVLLIDGLLLAGIYKTARRVVLGTMVNGVLLAIRASNWRSLAVLFGTLRDAWQTRLLGLSVLVATALRSSAPQGEWRQPTGLRWTTSSRRLASYKPANRPGVGEVPRAEPKVSSTHRFRSLPNSLSKNTQGSE